ncbi:MAG: hypothetical protein K2W96_14285 [Gemmataceae bacterium]|nr:hypothetical protein [Gemmataceae bacterium]
MTVRNASNLDQAREAALARIDRAERNYKLGIVLVAAFEAVFGLAFLLLMDFRERSHWLMLLAAMLAYGVVLISVVNVGKYLTASTNAILQALLARQREAAPEDGPGAGRS